MKLVKVLETHEEVDAWGRANPGVEMVDQDGGPYRYQGGRWETPNRHEAWIGIPYWNGSLPVQAPVKPPTPEVWGSGGRRTATSDDNREVYQCQVFDGEMVGGPVGRSSGLHWWEEHLDALTAALQTLCADKRERIHAVVEVAQGMVGLSNEGACVTCVLVAAGKSPVWVSVLASGAVHGLGSTETPLVTPDIDHPATQGLMLRQIQHTYPGAWLSPADRHFAVYNGLRGIQFRHTQVGMGKSAGLALLSVLEKIHRRTASREDS